MEKNDIMICRCEEIGRSEILDALKRGARSMDDIKRSTRACMGLCEGKTCKPLIARIMAEVTGRSLSEIAPSSFRPPVRPISLSALVEEPDPL